MRNHYPLILLILSFAAACTGAKNMYKKGETLSEAGMYREALPYYEESLSRDPNYVKSQIGMKKVAQRVLDEELQRFYAANATEDHKEAVYTYLRAVKMVERAKAFNVILDMPSNYEPIYRESEKAYLSTVYKEAQDALDREDFEVAKSKFKEIAAIEPTYKDVADLASLSEAEPLYRKALEAYDAGQNRKAYRYFQTIEKVRPGYKETRQLMPVALERGRYTLGIMKFENAGLIPGLEQAVASSISQQVLAMNDPFLVLVDRTKTDALLKEQKLALSGLVDAKTSARAGEILGAKALMSGKIIQARTARSNLVQERKPGYQAIPYTYRDPETGKKETRYRYQKTYNQQYYQESMVTVTFEYRVVSAETGEILASDVVEETLEDKINYARYDGDARNLYMGSWTSFNREMATDRILNNSRSKRELDNLLSARSTLRPTEELQSQVVDRIGSRIATRLISINPEME